MWPNFRLRSFSGSLMFISSFNHVHFAIFWSSRCCSLAFYLRFSFAHSLSIDRLITFILPFAHVLFRSLRFAGLIIQVHSDVNSRSVCSSLIFTLPFTNVHTAICSRSLWHPITYTRPVTLFICSFTHAPYEASLRRLPLLLNVFMSY